MALHCVKSIVWFRLPDLHPLEDESHGRISLQGKTNFFEKRVRDYQKACVMSSVNGGGAFDNHLIMYCHSSPTLLTLQFIININRIVATISGLLETISIHLWANVEKFDSLHKPNTNTVGIAFLIQGSSIHPLNAFHHLLREGS
ncbi:hypothetical protein HID58_010466, partial [Brassica napus]